LKHLSVLFAVVLCLPVLACKPQNNNTSNTTTATGTPTETGEPVRLGRACKEDIQKYCATAPKRRRCLRDNMDKLSADCKSALMAARANGGHGFGGGGGGVCRDDLLKYCAGKFGPDRRTCIQQNMNSFSDACKTVMQQRMNNRKNKQNNNNNGDD
jgi:hypothetical protein